MGSAALLAPRVMRGLAADPAVIRTPSGTLRGELLPAGIRIFRGVPYAVPPVGPLRFKPTQKLVPWQGERDATRFAAAALQPGDASNVHSEDCLYLNVWLPSTPGPHPIFLWFHGGGFTGGRSFDPELKGTAFARDGVIFITIANRLGALGYLDVGPLLGAEYAGSANNALHDIVTALDWIQKNIAAFGGDPAQVTIGGESAGAKLADTLLGVPAAVHLFHQVISESGGAERIASREQALAVGTAFGEVWREVAKSEPAALRTAEASQIIAAQTKFVAAYPQHFALRPEVDGHFLPRLSIETIAAGGARGKRLLIGSNTDESVSFVGPHPSHDATGADLANMTPERFKPVYERYRSIYPDFNEEHLRIRSVSAEEYWVPSVRVADAHVKGGGTAFMYRLDLQSEGGRFPGFTCHGMDIPMIFSEPDERKAGTFGALSAQMHEAWVSFIKGKAPVSEGLPAWPVYDEKTRPTLILDEKPHLERTPRDPELQLWQGLL